MSILFKKEISRTSGAPLGDQVKTHIRSRILNHEWEAGAKIPGEFELASQYGVARVTIRTALRSLEAQGLIDIRHGSSTFLQYFGVELSQDNMLSMFIPEGFAHGFQTLEDQSSLIYHHSEYYNPEADAGLLYNDAAFKIIWPLEAVNVSEKDKSYPIITDNFKGF